MGGWSPIHYWCTVIGKTFTMHSPVGKCYIPPCPVKRALIPDPFSAPQAKAADKQQLCPKVDFRTFLQRPPVNTTNKHSRLPVPLIWICPDMPGYFFQLLFTSRGQLALKTGSYLLVREGSSEGQRPAGLLGTGARQRGSLLLPARATPVLAGRGEPPLERHTFPLLAPPAVCLRIRSQAASWDRHEVLGSPPWPASRALPPRPPNMTPCVGEGDRRPL